MSKKFYIYLSGLPFGLTFLNNQNYFIMRRLAGLFLFGFLVFNLYSCGGSSGKQSENAGTNYQSIPVDLLPGTWKCTRFVLDNGMENDMMARMQGSLVFSDDEVVYMNQTYSYSIENDRLQLNHNGQRVLQPFAWDGESLVMQGDNALVYYNKD